MHLAWQNFFLWAAPGFEIVGGLAQVFSTPQSAGQMAGQHTGQRLLSGSEHQEENHCELFLGWLLGLFGFSMCAGQAVELALGHTGLAAGSGLGVAGVKKNTQEWTM